jgi:hypothetical protein
VCHGCTEQGRYAECFACRERTPFGFRFTRDAWTISALGSHSWAAFKRSWLTLVLGLLILAFSGMLVGLAQGAVQVEVLGIQGAQTPFAMKSVLVSSAVSLVLSLLLTPMMIGYIELCLTALRGRPVALGTIFVPYARFATVATLVVGFSALGFAYNLVFSFFFADQTLQQVYARIWLWALVASPLFFYVGSGLGFAYAVLADDPHVGALEALRRSWRIASGKRWPILGVWIISALATAFGVLMCLLPSVLAIPWASLLWSASYLALATPTPARGAAQ